MQTKSEVVAQAFRQSAQVKKSAQDLRARAVNNQVDVLKVESLIRQVRIAGDVITPIMDAHASGRINVNYFAEEQLFNSDWDSGIDLAQTWTASSAAGVALIDWFIATFPEDADGYRAIASFNYDTGRFEYRDLTSAQNTELIAKLDDLIAALP